MAIAKNRPLTSAALQRLLRAVQRVERLRPLDVNIQRLYRIEDQIREAFLEALNVESTAEYSAYVAAAAAPIIGNEVDIDTEEEK